MQSLCYYIVNKSKGTKNMSKYCKSYKLKVTYLDCLEYETKECKAKKVNKIEPMLIMPEQFVYMVFASKKEGYKENIVCKCKVRNITVYNDKNIYSMDLIKVVCGSDKAKDIGKWVTTFMCENENINTGIRIKPNRYPVFTEKEICKQWLKQK